MSSWPERNRFDSLRSVPLASVLALCGAQPDRSDKAKWHTAQGVLSVTGAKFMNWHCGQGGGGAIDLVMHLNQQNFKEAVQWLKRHFPAAAGWPSSEPTPKAKLQLPSAQPQKLERVRRYLVEQRALSPTLVESLIQSGILYADARANAVFLLLGDENTAVGAELRGTTGHWRAMAPGSQKDLGFFSIPTTARSTVVLCESAIDAISCYTLYPQHRCLSTAGARPNPRWLAALLRQGCSVWCGFDADATGEAMAQAMMARHPVVQRLRPRQHDWNDMLRARS